jgi:hypothetical protein
MFEGFSSSLNWQEGLKLEFERRVSLTAINFQTFR